MQIIDAHVHPFEVVSQRSGRYSEGVTDMEVFKEDLERAGITHCCGSVISRVDGSSCTRDSIRQASMCIPRSPGNPAKRSKRWLHRVLH